MVGGWGLGEGGFLTEGTASANTGDVGVDL